jgi:hypothetical protein
VTKVLKGDQVLVNPDHLARGAYEQRTAVTAQPAAPESATPAAAADAETDGEPEREREKEAV